MNGAFHLFLVTSIDLCGHHLVWEKIFLEFWLLLEFDLLEVEIGVCHAKSYLEVVIGLLRDMVVSLTYALENDLVR